MQKQGKISALVSGSIVLIISNLAVKAANFLFLPLYTKYLTNSDLGISDLITNLSAFVFPILVWGFDSAFSAFYYDEDSDKYRTEVFNTVSFFLMLTSIVTLVFIIGSRQVSLGLFHVTDYYPAVILSFLSIALNLWYLPYALYLRMNNRMLPYAIITGISSIVILISNVLLVAVLRMGHMSLIISTLTAHAVMLLLYYIFSGIRPSVKYVNISLLKKMLRYATPLVPLTVLAWILSLSDRYIINYFLGEAEVGIYGIAARFVSLLNIVTSAFSVSYTTFAYASKNDANAKEQYIRVLDTVFSIMAILCWTVCVFGKDIVRIMTTEPYYPAYELLPSLLFGQAFYIVSTIVGYGIAFTKKSKFYLLSTSAGALLNIVLNILFIPVMGVKAAAFTTFLGYFTVMILNYYIAGRLYPCKYHMGKIVVSAVGLYTISIFIQGKSILLRAIIYILCLSALVFAYKDVIRTVLGKVQSIARKILRR